MWESRAAREAGSARDERASLSAVPTGQEAREPPVMTSPDPLCANGQLSGQPASWLWPVKSERQECQPQVVDLHHPGELDMAAQDCACPAHAARLAGGRTGVGVGSAESCADDRSLAKQRTALPSAAQIWWQAEKTLADGSVWCEMRRSVALPDPRYLSELICMAGTE